jgi:hypothetical protein
MPYVASIDTDMSWRVGVFPVAEVDDFFTGIELISYEDVGFAEGVRGLRTRRSGGHDYRQGGLDGARIGLAHNTIPTAVSAVTTLEGATDGAG